MNWIFILYQVSDFIVIFCLILWTKGREMSLFYRVPATRMLCNRKGSHFLSLNSKASLLIWIKGVSYLPVISSESISSQPCHPPIRGEQTKRSGMWFGSKEHFFPGENGETFSLSAVTWLMWSLFFKIKSPLLAHDVVSVKTKQTNKKTQQQQKKAAARTIKCQEEMGQGEKEKAHQAKLQITFFSRKSIQYTIISILPAGHFAGFPR